jgi:hypothetical protein
MKARHGKRQAGFVQSLELMLLATCAVALVAVSSASIGTELAAEYADLGSAIGALDQSYSLGGMAVAHPDDPTGGGAAATWAGSAFTDDDANVPSCGVFVCIPPDAGAGDAAR